MTARPFHPKMGRRRRPAHEVPGWVLVAVAVLLVLATAWTEGASPGAMTSLSIGIVLWTTIDPAHQVFEHRKELAA